MGIENVLPVEVEEERRLVWTEVAILLGMVALPVWAADLFAPAHFAGSLLEDSTLRLARDLPLCALALYMMARAGRGWPHFGLGKNWDFVGMFAFFIGAVVVGLLSTWLTDLIFQAVTGTVQPVDLSDQLFTPRVVGEWLSIWPVLLVGAAAEELVFRGFATARLYDVTGRKWIAVLLPAAVFGSVHFYQGVIPAIGITVYGALFGLMFLEWRRLKALILAHFAFNVWAFAYYIQ